MSSTDESMEIVAPRRSTRQRKPKILPGCESPVSNDVESSSEDDMVDPEKPSEMLLEDNIIAGKEMFGFKTMKRKNALSKRVTEVLNSPALSSTTTPQKLKKGMKLPAATPHTTRYKIKKELVALLDDMSSDGDFVDSESDFQPSDASKESSESAEESDASNESIESAPEEVKTKTRRKPETKSNKKDFTYIMKSDDYFSQSSTKNVTSNHTLQKLKNPKLSEDQLQELLASCNLNLSTAHEASINNLLENSYAFFDKWLCLLNEGFNVLLYGLGSKRKILLAFQSEMLGEHPVVLINGFFPSLTIKDIIDCILTDIFEHKDSSLSLFEAVSVIEQYLIDMPNVHLYVIVHNIDGPMLRNSKTQNVLASLAAVRNVHLIASVDHINTPLIWNHSKLSKFNFTWWDVTSFLPYKEETSFESSMLVQRSGALALSSLTNVFQSLTKNSRGIYMLIIKYQLDNKSVKHYQGMPFKVLYSQCRENFLVSSDLALRAQLTEFLDHKLVKSKRSFDGTEQLVIPIHNTLLQQFVDQES